MSDTFIIGHTQPRPDETGSKANDPLFAAKQGFASHALKIDIPTMLDTRMIVCANSGGGKSWLFRLIAERVGKSVSTWVIDPEGEYATLREWLDIAVVGGKGEIPLTVASAALTARRLYEASVGAVFDLSDLDIDEKRACVHEIAMELLRVSKHPTHSLCFFVDEAHQLCPQVGTVESSAAIKRIMDSGRKREICGMLATQRVTKLHNDAIGEARNVAIGLTNLAADQERAGDLLGMNKQQRGLLSALGKGEFYLYGPSVQAQGVSFFKSDQVRTTHPQVGKRSLLQVPPASEAMKKLLGQLGDLPAQAQEETREIETLRRENARLQYELKARPTQIQIAEPRVEIQVVEKPVLNGEVPALLSGIEALRATLAPLRELPETLTPLANILTVIVEKVERVEHARLTPPPVDFAKYANMSPQQIEHDLGFKAVAKALGTTTPFPNETKELLSNYMRDLLQTFAKRHPLPLTKSQLALLAGKGKKSSALDGALAAIKRMGLVTNSNEMELTESGFSALGSDVPAPPQTFQDIVRLWREVLNEYERALFDALEESRRHGNRAGLTADELSQRSGKSKTSSQFQSTVAMFIKNKIAVRHGERIALHNPLGDN